MRSNPACPIAPSQKLDESATGQRLRREANVPWPDQRQNPLGRPAPAQKP